MCALTAVTLKPLLINIARSIHKRLTATTAIAAAVSAARVRLLKYRNMCVFEGGKGAERGRIVDKSQNTCE